MGVARKVTKQDLVLLSDLIFNSYIISEFEFLGHYFVLRSLTTQEREEISRKYKYLSNKYNMKLVLEILTFSILYINGCEFNRSKHKRFIYRFNSRLILKLFSEYQKMDSLIVESSKFIDYYMETRESRNMWSVFKTCSKVQEPFAIRHFNQYQFYWIISNVFKDSLEEEKHSWSRVEYMTNSICAFLNPKAFRKTKNQMGIVERLEQQEDKEKQQIVEELEGLVKEVVESNDVFSSMERRHEETEEEYEYRINTLMEKTLKGELVDEHDRLVREDEIKFLKKFLREKRMQVLVERELHSRKGYHFDSTEALENEALKIQLEEDRKLGFFHDDFSYIEIVNMKDFMAISKKEKQEAFNEVMSEEIDVETEVNHFLKNLSSKRAIEGDLEGLKSDEPEPIDIPVENAKQGETDSNNARNDVMKTSAEKASSMTVNVEGVDLLKQKQEKIRNAIRALSRRNIPNLKREDTDLDVMKFE